jgi:hypothetical protein
MASADQGLNQAFKVQLHSVKSAPFSKLERPVLETLSHSLT